MSDERWDRFCALAEKAGMVPKKAVRQDERGDIWNVFQGWVEGELRWEAREDRV